MPPEFQGTPHGAGRRFAIVVSRYNAAITRNLLDGAVSTLNAHGVSNEQLDIVWVPGAWEISLVTQRLAESAVYDAIICLGAVIRGETTHDQHINRQVSLALGEIGRVTGVPCTFGVLTCNSVEQAMQRSGGSHGNKGAECALAAMEMVDLLRQLPQADDVY